MMYKTRSVSSVQYPSHWNGLQFVVMSIFFCLLLDTSNTIASAQEIQKANIPGTFAWGGVTSDVTGTYLTAAQKPSSPIYNSPQQIFYSKDAGNTWATSNAPAIGYYGIAAAISTPNIVVAGGYNGIYISNDYGANWVSKSTFIGNGGAAISANGQIMALVKLTSSNCMAYSSNQGATWSTNLGPTGLTGSCESIAVSSNTIVIGTAGSGIYVSTNAGTSWTVTYPTTSTIISITYGGGVFYAGMRDSPYYILMSTDAGSSWQVTSGSQTTSPSVWQVAVASNVPSYLAVAATELYVTTDSGVTYTQKTGNSMTKVIAVNGDGSLALFNAGNNSISYLYYGNLGKPTSTPFIRVSFNHLSLIATLTPAPSFAPSMAPTTNVVFPTNPKYAVSKLYSDASCTHFTSMGTIIVNTCLKVSNIRYMKFTCGKRLTVLLLNSYEISHY